MARNKEGRPEWFKLWRKNRPLVLNELLDLESRGRIFTNMYRYFDGESLLDMSPVESMAWAAVQQNIDEAFEDYDKRVTVNTENGSKGGRPAKKPNGL